MHIPTVVRPAFLAAAVALSAATIACGPAKPAADAPATPAADAKPENVAARTAYRAKVDSLLAAAVAAGDSAKGDSLIKARSDSEHIWLKPAK